MPRSWWISSMTPRTPTLMSAPTDWSVSARRRFLRTSSRRCENAPADSKDKQGGRVRKNFAAILAICLFSFVSAAQVDRPCWTATDAANWAQELTEKTPRSELQDVLNYLAIGTERCRDEKAKADAWYFRGLLERHLGGNAQLADRYISRGRDGGSRPAIENQPLFGNKRDNSKPATARPVREKWAVVVGIGQFQSSAIPALRYTGKDARDFAKVLTDPEVGRFKPENVQTLTDKDATLVNIRKAIGSIRDKA